MESQCSRKTTKPGGRLVSAAETFGKAEIVSATRRQLTWTHIKTLAYVSDGLKREFLKGA